MRQLAIRSALSAKNQAAQLFVVAGLAEIEPRTRVMRETLARLPLNEARSTLILAGESRENIYRGAGNLENVKVLPAQYVNMHDVFKYERLLVTREALDIIHDLWAQGEQ